MDRRMAHQHARGMAKQLKERNSNAVFIIQRIIEYMGLDYAKQMFEKTMEVQSNGGMMVVSGKRKRTTGGIFFYLVKEDVDAEMNAKIFIHGSALIKWHEQRRAEIAAREGARQPEAASPETVNEQEEIDIAKLSEAEQKKLRSLETTARVLRERLQKMQAEGQKGSKMTRTLLENTERQIAKLKEGSV